MRWVAPERLADEVSLSALRRAFEEMATQKLGRCRFELVEVRYPKGMRNAGVDASAEAMREFRFMATAESDD